LTPAEAPFVVDELQAGPMTVTLTPAGQDDEGANASCAVYAKKLACRP